MLHNDEIGKITPADMGNRDEYCSKIFENVFGGDFKVKVAKKLCTTLTEKPIDVFITGPFCNTNNGKSTWVVVYGDTKREFMLKSEFVRSYLKTILLSLNGNTIDANHCQTYYNINIRQREFGNANYWRRTKREKLYQECHLYSPVINQKRKVQWNL